MAPLNQESKRDGPEASPPSPSAPGDRGTFLTHLSMDEVSAPDLCPDDDTCASDPDDGAAPPPAPGSFLLHIARSSGPPQIIALSLLLALSLGSTIGVVPAVVEDRYARLRHGYGGEPCMDFGREDRPMECQRGNEDAQNAAAVESFVNNALTFATSSLIGSISDERGRRGLMLLALGLSLLSPITLVLLQLVESMDPFLYYACRAMSGVVSFIAVSLSAVSDVMPFQFRAPAFGLILAGFSMGLALSPTMAVYLNHLEVSILSLGITAAGFVFACFFLPETLSRETSELARTKRLAERPDMETRVDVIKYNLLRPAKALLILNRSNLFRLLSALAFFSGCVGSADQTLLLYYVEGNLEFGDKDVAKFFLIIGAMGIFVQTVVLKPLNTCIGERRVIIVAFLVGSLHNYLYGVAKEKRTIFIAAALASLTGMSFPTISAIKSNNADENEQGRIQGALYSLSSLASAVGPMMLRYVYSRTKDGGGYGKGTMFVFGAGLYLVATVCAWFLPEEQANSNLKKCAPKCDNRAAFDPKNSEYGAIGNVAQAKEEREIV